MWSCKYANFWHITVVLVLTTCFCTCGSVNSGIEKRGKEFKIGRELQNEMTLTLKEKLAFEKFKQTVWPHIFRIDIKSDLFLLRWIRAKNLDVDLAMRHFLEWKAYYIKNNLDNIMEEDWSDFELDMPYHTDAVDREGRPVAYVHLRDGWDLRAAILQGKQRRMEKYFIRLFTIMLVNVAESYRRDPNINQFLFLINCDGFNIIQHGCPRCLQSLMSLFQMYERWLPGFFREFIFVDAPRTFVMFFQAGRPALSKHTQNSVKIFDKNRSQWIQYLQERIDPSQLPGDFGGTKDEHKF